MNVLHYRGDRRSYVDKCDGPLGPDRAGAYWLPVGAKYDPATDTTTMRFKPGSYPSLMKELTERRL